jgi:predicted DNA-binding transcriptional regulator AlpA
METSARSTATLSGSGLGASLLTDTKGVAALTGRSGASVRRDDAAGRMPRSIRLGRSKRWRIAEVVAWVEAGCPDRATWEAREKAD